MKWTCFLAVLVFMFTSCDEEDALVGPSNFSYSESSINVDFYTKGNTGVPVINWNGATGTFGLSSNIPGISVNSTNGVLSWDRDLELGETEVEVVATNSVSSTTTAITVNHIFSGFFRGGYNFNPNSTVVSGTNFTLDFKANGDLDVNDSGLSGSGTWQFTSATSFTATYKYDGNTNAVFIDGSIFYDESTTPYITGLWGFAANDLSSGQYKVELE